ncbi:hypothetical protein ACHAW5_008007 [Stephanodiscus triporus]|uniref:SHSP domain-containing protein n=1 Tax=Stephanodiscus triporus TaxID=2934178 RepID=A0ABD3P863_9STRA
MSIDTSSVFFTFSPMPPAHHLGVPPSLTRSKDDTVHHSSPRYDVAETNKQLRLAVDVPGMKPDDLVIELENDGHVLHLSGTRRVEAGGTHDEGYHFDKHFKLGRILDTSKITAHLSDGVLVLTAPKMEKPTPLTQRIAIVRGEAPALIDADEEKKSG